MATKTRVAIVGVVQHRNHILILKRSPRKKYSPDLWEFVGGFLREGEATEDCAVRETREEMGLKGQVVKRGRVFETGDRWSNWIVIPHLMRVRSTDVRLSHEHTEYRWILPKEIAKFECVVDARKDLKAVGLL